MAGNIDGNAVAGLSGTVVSLLTAPTALTAELGIGSRDREIAGAA